MSDLKLKRIFTRKTIFLAAAVISVLAAVWIVVGRHQDTVYYEYDATTKRVSYSYFSDGDAFKVTIGPNGHNELPNIISIQKAEKPVDLASASWKLLSSARTDYLPPMVFMAAKDGDGARAFYTGGAHGGDGGGGGDRTAKNTKWSVMIDGREVIATSSGYAKELRGIVINELMAYNTVSSGRYAIRQSFMLDMTDSGTEVSAEVKALEPVVVLTDNGPQAYFGGFTESQMIVDSKLPGRTPLDPSAVSGRRDQYERAWLLLMKSRDGTMACWVDRGFEAGDGRYVAPTSSFIRGGGKGRAKFYNAIVAAKKTSLSAGDSYRWRGGYHFFADTQGDGFDTRTELTIGGERRSVLVTHEGISSIAPL
ncbi:hypothetical protein V9K81_06800 [Pseudomonas monteilii]|uniref:hypothetical protein n=1 Tax=Pseudomonas monteilii TaxID=76759 RepID=UPI0030D0F7ED